MCRMTGLSRSSIGRRIKAGQFPEGFLLGGEGSRCKGWFRHDVEAWLMGRWRATHGENLGQHNEMPPAPGLPV